MKKYLSGDCLTCKSMYWYPANETDKEIGRLEDLNKAKGACIKAQAKNIGRLIKEKEWLIDSMVIMYEPITANDRKEHKKRITEAMQQALKEEP